MDVLTVKALFDPGQGEGVFDLVAGREEAGLKLGVPALRMYPGGTQGSSVPSGGGLLISSEILCSLETSSREDRERFFEKLFSRRPEYVVVAEASGSFPTLVDACDREGIPLFFTDMGLHAAENEILRRLREKVHGKTFIHGVLMEVSGIGILISGESGIGKSECALELVNRGHKLVSDDLVHVEKRGDGTLRGRSPERTRYFMEIRGLGLVNVKGLFGVASVLEETSLDVNVELVPWKAESVFDRIESEERRRMILGVNVPLVRVPVRSGGNMATIVEIVAKNRLLKKERERESREILLKIEESRFLR